MKLYLFCSLSAGHLDGPVIMSKGYLKSHIFYSIYLDCVYLEIFFNLKLKRKELGKHCGVTEVPHALNYLLFGYAP